MRKLLFLLAMVTTFIAPSSIAAAQDEVSTSATLNDLQAEGRYVEGVLSSDDSTGIDQANSDGIAFVWLNQPFLSDNAAPNLAAELRSELRLQGTPYTDVFVLIDDGTGSTIGLGAASDSASNSEVDAAVTASSQLFLLGDIGAGITLYADTINENSVTSSGNAETNADSTDSGNSSQISFFGLFIILLILGGGLFILFRVISSRRKAKKAAANDMAADRAEIEEQLKNNADRVITLGDDVIASKDDELIRTYEEASAVYQEVSTSLASATTPAQVDELDDKIDKAEWQFDVIEAKIAGKPAPLSPKEQEAKQAQENKTRQGRGPQDQATSDRPALGRDETVFPGGASQQPHQRRNSGGFGGSNMGGGLGSVLGSILMGGSLGGGRSSRRTQHRRIGGTSRNRSGRNSGGFNDPFGGASRRSKKSSGGRGGGRFSRGGRGGGGFRR